MCLLLQILETLTEYCQGPCYENQVCIAMHESNGLGIITALILNDINPLGMTRMDLVLELKNNASKLLLAIMESRTSGIQPYVGEQKSPGGGPSEIFIAMGGFLGGGRVAFLGLFRRGPPPPGPPSVLMYEIYT